MSTIQTKIPFSARKKASISISSKKSKTEKENFHEKSPSPLKSPTFETERDKRFLLKSNSPCKRRHQHLSEDGVSPAKRECSTPSSLINRLSVTSPKCASRKELFPSNEVKKVFREAVLALHSTAPASLPCRDDKLTELRTFIETHLHDETSGSLYISGPPGTGKTASLNILLSDPKIYKNCKVINVNCTSIKSSASMYARVAEELNLKIPAPKSEKKFVSAIEKYLTTCQKMVLLILDELDQLESRKQCVLYSIFEWPSIKNSRLVLIGIANALDLTDRVLPRLQARVQLQPKLLHFPPYSRQQIIEIITRRLTEAGVDKIFPQSALQLLASKVAAVSGDVRRALDTARRVIELSHTQTETKENDEEKSENIVTIKQVLDVVNNVYSTSQTLIKNEDEDSSVESFPLQQKLLICSVLLLLKQGKSKDITVGKLHEVYCKVCEKRNLVAVDVSEFISLTNLVEARGILRLQGKIKNRLSKISLQWDEREMISALQDKKLLASILGDKFCIQR